MFVISVAGNLEEITPILEVVASHREEIVIIPGTPYPTSGYCDTTPAGREMALTQSARDLATALTTRGRPALALSGRDTGTLQASPAKALNTVQAVNTFTLDMLLQHGLIPVVAPVAWGDPYPLEVEPAQAAAAIAAAMAGIFVNLTDVDLEPRSLSLSEALAISRDSAIIDNLVHSLNWALGSLRRGACAAVVASYHSNLEAVLQGQSGWRIVAPQHSQVLNVSL